MAFINEQTKEVNCKVVYYGPPRCGKSTSLRYIYESVKEEKRGELVSLAGKSDKTLFFDFVPLSLGKFKNYQIRLHLYTVPGDVAYESARKIISKGVDGVVCVADSQLEKLESNLQSMMELKEMVEEMGEDFETLPLVFQYNKRDLANPVPIGELRQLLNPRKVPDFETVATQGRGVYDALKAIAKEVLKSLRK
ncbi:MAG: gliding-motility protein MglA [Deltaproteobacteria bacterium RIFCSPLOWO2_01_44_7]|nr:MAG: gliding-motility protein MglA [Deltaproteobacteria bacterium RIFCSPHIGHO2_01_FULL_43_49]OGQ14520.1 MAG: gliding-motility protein MglA [Deltaproteobacteria bacterium RIFCSPHIGHO2_02_FULL_44_53]OGQ27906.1 MAG: gliding-motility protein MglA [Deltaproteobacteria bacterium RIFCSPHIGHO2_12_FULL_44_21]OGQ31118.1 MAG: gliding-motility protein MglA [Deltaproteobacteria bacterium RIFCSPLOWO2_01_FULL_45_74]OGQ38212.1 MAG: gliding-motility protein MglA [Deltaproteobacteria bacterium RIFCSPLOWO2_01_